ncbi:MAG: CRISPR system precrRNA processing endoribonuclease RAMP protein Cas6 [Geminicoccaceae bacterium]
MDSGLPVADAPVPVAALWRHIRICEIVAYCERPPGLDAGWSLAGRVRGALGRAFGEVPPVRRRPWPLPGAFELLFGEAVAMPEVRGDLFANPTRPYLLFVREREGGFEVVVRLFGWSACWEREVAVALERGLAGGISVAAGARARARLRPVMAPRCEVPVPPPAESGTVAQLSFLSPVAFEREGALAADREMLLGSLLSRIAGVTAWHGIVVEADWAELARVEAGIEFDTGGLRPVAFERVSARQARRIPMHGFLGSCTLSGYLGPWLPLLHLAPLLHLGSHTAFGMGRCTVAVSEGV